MFERSNYIKVPQDVYDQLEAKVNEIISSGTLDRKRQISYQTFLFTIMYASHDILFLGD